MPCSNCSKKVLARGLCQACYYRLRRNGSVERKNAVNKGRACIVEGCEQPAHAKNLCALHYQRSQHPLTTTWKLLRSRNKGDYAAIWDDFDVFLRHVGERPSPKHQLRRKDPLWPWRKDNVEWIEPIEQKFGAAYQSEWHLRRKYGLSVEEYESRVKAQGGKCAICGKSQKKRLFVDHCHATGNVRGLLCGTCNSGLGQLGDTKERVLSVLAYLTAAEA